MERYVNCAFLALNAGLALMILLSLFPGGLLQIRDVLDHGYWHPRSLLYSGTGIARLVEWLSLSGDLVLILARALPNAIALGIGYADSWRYAPRAEPRRPEPAEQGCQDGSTIRMRWRTGARCEGGIPASGSVAQDQAHPQAAAAPPGGRKPAGATLTPAGS